MKGNPYSEILQIMKDQNETRDNVMIGNVISPNPLTIQIGELRIDKDNIYIADTLTKGHSREYTTTRVAGEGGENKGTLTYATGLVSGDKVAILQTGDKQLYIVIARLREA